MLTTNHIGTEDTPRAHPEVAYSARKLFNMTDNERSGVVSTATTFLALYSDPIIAAMTAHSDWGITDLKSAERPVSLYLVVPPSDISRTKPLMRLILNQIARRLTETLEVANDHFHRRNLLLMLDEFPALGRLEFFETSLAFLAGYGVRAFLVAQSLNQIDKAYGPNHSILDNCHVRVAFSPNDERTAKRLSDALGIGTQLRTQHNFSGKRFAAWLSHTSVSQHETPRPLLTAGEILQLPQDDALVLVSGAPPIRAKKLKYYSDRNFLDRRLLAPELSTGRYADAPPHRDNDWSGCMRGADGRLDRTWSELVSSRAPQDSGPSPIPEVPPSDNDESNQRRDLALLAELLFDPTLEDDARFSEDNNVIQLPNRRVS
jgi:type IV secretion system protein VirD4